LTVTALRIIAPWALPRASPPMAAIRPAGKPPRDPRRLSVRPLRALFEPPHLMAFRFTLTRGNGAEKQKHGGEK